MDIENKLIQQFGCTPIDDKLRKRFKKVTNHPPHLFLRRGLFCSHRDLDLILDDYEAKRPIYIYTGRGPSAGSFHLGHLVPFLFTAWLQKVFEAHVVIQITDDDKFLTGTTDFDVLSTNTRENIRDIIACGFDPSKTYIFSNFSCMAGDLYRNTVRVWSKITNNQVNATFGINGSDHIGKSAFVGVQIAPSLASTFSWIPKEARCLIPQGLDQDPYFRLARDVAPKLGHKKPSLIHSRLIPSLQGVQSKMSSSKPKTAIFVSDTPKQVKNKIMSAVSGGRECYTYQRHIGAVLQEDVPFHLLEYFLESDDELERIRLHYGPGTSESPKILTGSVKRHCIEVILEVLRVHNEKKNRVTDSVIEEFTKKKK